MKLGQMFEKYYLDKYYIRYSLREIKKQFGDTPLVGVEIGTRDGSNARLFCKHLNIKCLYLVDPYDAYCDVGSVKSFHNSFLHAKKVLSSYSNKVRFIKRLSEDAVELIPNNLDFVYIDGNHSYDFVKKDIELYYPKLNANGIIGGHDFNCPDVAHAVIEYAVANDLNIERSFCLPRIDWVFKSGVKPNEDRAI